jgi:hypothetical protein
MCTCVMALSVFAMQSPLATYLCLAWGVKHVCLRSGNHLIVPTAPAPPLPPPPATAAADWLALLSKVPSGPTWQPLMATLYR